MKLTPQNLSRGNIIAITIWSLFILSLLVCVREDTWQATKPVLLKQAESTPKPKLPDAIPLAQIEARRVIPVALAQSKKPETRDDGFGVCPAFTHYHSIEPHDYSKPWPAPDERGSWTTIAADGQCHSDLTDEPINPRKALPKPYKPDPRAKWL